MILLFLKEQLMIKTQNHLVLIPLMLAILKLEALMFDCIYDDLMLLVKSVELCKSAASTVKSYLNFIFNY